MKVYKECKECIIRHQIERVEDKKDREKAEKYIDAVRNIIAECTDENSAPYLAYRMDRAYEEIFEESTSMREFNNKSNAFVMSMEDEIQKKIESAEDPLEKAIAYARVGNYIDTAALGKSLNPEKFLSLLEETGNVRLDKENYDIFLEKCRNGKEFMLVTDNNGEVVIDKIFLRILHKTFPHLNITVMVRGGEAFNDASMEDAEFIGMTKEFRVISSGSPVAGTIISDLSEEARSALYGADVVVAKGQGNYESLKGCDIPIFYSLLCKCDWFMDHFRVPQFTGVFSYE